MAPEPTLGSHKTRRVQYTGKMLGKARISAMLRRAVWR
jgi:hypothetical protein